MRGIRTISLLVIFSLLLHVWGTPMPVQADSQLFVSTSGSDQNACTSPAAACRTIQAAINKAAAGSSILVTNGTWVGSQTDVQVVLINTSLTLSGGWNGAFTDQTGSTVIDGQHVRRGVTISGGLEVSLDHLTIQNGFSYQDQYTGAGMNVGAGAKIGLSNVVIQNNGTYNAPGGGMYLQSSVQALVRNSVVRGNISYGDGAGIYAVDGVVTIENSEISGNNAKNGYASYSGRGGGVASAYGSVVLIGSVIQNNNAASDGGGVWAQAIRLTDTAVTNNDGKDGGGLFGATIDALRSSINHNSGDHGGGVAGAKITLENTSLLNNMAIYGGAISPAKTYSPYSAEPPHQITLNNSTIAENYALVSGGGIWYESSSDPFYAPYMAAIHLQNSLVAENDAPNSANCADAKNSTPIISDGYNLVDDTTGCLITTQATDLLNQPAKVKASRNAQTFPLLAGSPAIDAGNPSGCLGSDGNPLASDQVGKSRALDGNDDGQARCDIGAVEFDPDAHFNRVSLPVLMTDKNSFFDNFEDFYSGWPIFIDDDVIGRYDRGRYALTVITSNLFMTIAAPTGEASHYTLEADVTSSLNNEDVSSGLAFNIEKNFEHYYIFDYNSDFCLFRLLRVDQHNFTTLVPARTSNALKCGETGSIVTEYDPNHLAVTRDGTLLTLSINGQQVARLTDASLQRPGRPGVMAMSGHVGTMGIYDNFRFVSRPSGVSAAVMPFDALFQAAGAADQPSLNVQSLHKVTGSAAWTVNEKDNAGSSTP